MAAVGANPAGRPAPRRRVWRRWSSRMIIVKSEADIRAMRDAGRMVADVRDAIARRVVPGVTTAELADAAHALIVEAGAENAFLGYRGFPGKICVSVNDVVVHGVPGARKIALGDIVSVDVGLRFGGFVGDTALTVMVGVSDLRVVNLVRTAERALADGIAAARSGNRVSDISHAIQATVEAAGFSVVRDFVGHGIGRRMHEDPQVPNFGPAGRGAVLRAGMALAIEPMVNMGVPDVKVDADGWTVRTADGCPSAHVEHMVVVRDGEPEILTLSRSR
jgi:methionyl aminopeptidase